MSNVHEVVPFSVSQMQPHLAEAATSVEKATRGKPAAMEPKLNGVRIMANVTDNGVDFYTRAGNGHAGKFPLIEAELLATFPAGTWLDGELVDLQMVGGKAIHNFNRVNAILRSSTERAARMSGDLSYMIFDLLAVGDNDHRQQTYAERRLLLAKPEYKFEDLERVALVTSMDATEDNYARLLEVGFEGAVVKLLNSTYCSGKEGHGWSKVKAIETEDFVVMGFKPGKGSNEGLIGSIEFGGYRDGKLVRVGACSGMTVDERIDITERQDELIGTVIEVAYNERYENSVRHPRLVRLRPDKDAKDCVL